MKSIQFGEQNRSGNLLHIETVGCVVNIRIGLMNTQGQAVTSVQIIPDDYADEKWTLDGTLNNRVIQTKGD
jgi:hypothetical protein